MIPDADVERDGTLHRLDDVPEGHLLGRPAEDVAPPRTAAGPHQALVDQLLDDLLEELARDALASGDLGQRADALAGGFGGEGEVGPGRVGGLSGHPPERPLAL